MSKGPSQATTLVEVALATDGREILRTQGRDRCRSWLTWSYYRRTGAAPRQRHVREAVAMLERMLAGEAS